MIVDDQTWASIIEETKAGINKWNAIAVERGLEDRFLVHVFDMRPNTALVTEHRERYGIESKAVVREADGHIRKAKPIVKKGRIAGIKCGGHDPKAWSSLADKPAADIVKKLGLTNYIMVLRATMTGTCIIK